MKNHTPVDYHKIAVKHLSKDKEGAVLSAVIGVLVFAALLILWLNHTVSKAPSCMSPI